MSDPPTNTKFKHPTTKHSPQRCLLNVQNTSELTIQPLYIISVLLQINLKVHKPSRNEHHWLSLPHHYQLRERHRSPERFESNNLAAPYLVCSESYDDLHKYLVFPITFSFGVHPRTSHRHLTHSSPHQYPHPIRDRCRRRRFHRSSLSKNGHASLSRERMSGVRCFNCLCHLYPIFLGKSKSKEEG